MAAHRVSALRGENDDDGGEMEAFEAIHQAAVSMMAIGKDVFARAERIQLRLEREMQRSGRGGILSDSSSSLLTVEAETTLMMDLEIEASSLVPKIEALYASMIEFAWVNLHLGWMGWVRANKAAYRICRFIPRASVPAAKLSPSLQHPPPPIHRATSYDQPLGASQPNTNHQTQQLSSSFPSRPVLLQSVSPTAGSPPLEDADASSFKSIAIGLGKRLFQQRFLPGTTSMNPSSLDPPPVLGQATMGSSYHHQQHQDRVPATPIIAPEGPLSVLLVKYRGGLVGLAEVAGSPVDAALIRDGQLRDPVLVQSLDRMDIALRVCIVAERLVRWMLTRETPSGVADVPSSLKKLFVIQVPVLDGNDLKPLEESLAELSRRASGGIVS